MPILYRPGTGPTDSKSETPSRPAETPPPIRSSRPVPVTRTSMIWASVWACAVMAIGFIVFMLQNTAGVQISFLGLHGELPLAVALLIAMVAGILFTLVLGTARITQVRRLARRRRR